MSHDAVEVVAAGTRGRHLTAGHDERRGAIGDGRGERVIGRRLINGGREGSDPPPC